MIIASNKAGITLIFLSMFTSCASLKLSMSKDNLLCQSYPGKPLEGALTSGMVFIEPGSFTFGNDNGHQDETSYNFDFFPEESGAHSVYLEGFWIDVHEVTNAQFQEFVDATGYVTVAERIPTTGLSSNETKISFRDAGSVVFHPPDKAQNSMSANQWWQFIAGANWRHPLGPQSDLKGKMNHPVVHVAYEDAKAYADWAQKELPSEAQWEYAAKGGLANKPYAWGETLKPGHRWMANTFQGEFPFNDTADDGFKGTAPVGCYPPNGFGLFDVAGNVWEIVSDAYGPGHRQSSSHQSTCMEQSLSTQKTDFDTHVIKGGSYLCSPDYCMRYRPSARQGHDTAFGTSHIGFRTVLNVPKSTR